MVGQGIELATVDVLDMFTWYLLSQSHGDTATMFKFHQSSSRSGLSAD